MLLHRGLFSSDSSVGNFLDTKDFLPRKKACLPFAYMLGGSWQASPKFNHFAIQLMAVS
jgi:hypothetical protein